MQPLLVPENLKKAREAIGISKAEAARRMNIPQSSYVRYENGTRRPTHATIIQMAQVLNTSADFLIGKTTSDDADTVLINKFQSPELYEMSKGALELNEEQFKRLYAYYLGLRDMSKAKDYLESIKKE